MQNGIVLSINLAPKSFLLGTINCVIKLKLKIQPFPSSFLFPAVGKQGCTATWEIKAGEGGVCRTHWHSQCMFSALAPLAHLISEHKQSFESSGGTLNSFSCKPLGKSERFLKVTRECGWFTRQGQKWTAKRLAAPVPRRHECMTHFFSCVFGNSLL